MIFVPIMKLLRVENNRTHGTFGTFVMNDEAFCVTLEPPDKMNKKNISCIPALQYICKRTISPKFGETSPESEVFPFILDQYSSEVWTSSPGI